MKQNTARQYPPRYDGVDRIGHFCLHLDAELLNISLRGMAVRVTVRQVVGNIVHAELRWERGVLGLKGTVTWCNPCVDGQSGAEGPSGQYDVGISFSDGPDDKSAEVFAFIDSTPILKVKRGTFGRFELDYSDPVLLKATSPLRLMSLGLSGMRFETQVEVVQDSTLEVSIPLNGENFFFWGCVVDVSPQYSDEGTGVFRVDLDFVGVTEAQNTELGALLEDLSDQGSS